MTRTVRATEDQEHRLVIQWATLMQRQWPVLRWLVHTPNGGSRNKAEAAKLKGMGVRPGWPDLILHNDNRGHKDMYFEYVGIALELKRIDGGAGMTTDQYDALEHLRDHRFFVAECWGAQTAIDTLHKYLSHEIMPRLPDKAIPIIAPGNQIMPARRKPPPKPRSKTP